MKIFTILGIVFALILAGPTTVLAGGSGKVVPYIGNDEASATFLVEAIARSIVEALNLSGGDAKEATEANEANYYKYARDLAKTLSQLSPSEQNFVWYGS